MFNIHGNGQEHYDNAKFTPTFQVFKYTQVRKGGSKFRTRRQHKMRTIASPNFLLFLDALLSFN